MTARQLERMSPEQLATFTQDLAPIDAEFTSESDIVVFVIGIDAEHGLTGWRVEHIRALDLIDDDQAAETEELTQLECVTRGTQVGFADAGLRLFHPHRTPFDPRSVLQAIYEKLIALIQTDEVKLPALTIPPRPELELYESPEVDADVFTQQGPPWDSSVVLSGSESD